MKTVKISVVATVASILAWAVHVPQIVWPAHPRFADFLMALGLCIILQVVWADPAKSKNEKES